MSKKDKYLSKPVLIDVVTLKKIDDISNNEPVLDIMLNLFSGKNFHKIVMERNDKQNKNKEMTNKDKLKIINDECFFGRHDEHDSASFRNNLKKLRFLITNYELGIGGH